MNERVVFDAALEIDDLQARRDFVEKSCEDNDPMRLAVEALLKSHEAAGSFLNMPIGDQVRGEQSRGEPMKSDPTKNGDSQGSNDSNIPKKMNDPSDKTQIYESGVHKEDVDDDESSPDLSFLQPSSKPGSIGVLGHYEVLQVLGQGGFGIVFKAFDEKLHRHVAIKVMNAQMAATSPPRKRFLREARAAAAIRHENIVQVYSVEEQPLPYLVMEFIDGPTLQQKQAGHGPLEAPEWLHIGKQLASGLASAHATGLIHRDIKPGNVLIEQGTEQKVKITDFGLARAADDASLSRSGTISGTPMYMAPEQALGHTLDHRADLFSLGSVLYELATGRPPFRAANTVAVLRRVVDDTPRPMQEIIPELPDWLVAIVNKLLAKQPDDRFQTAKEVADLLSRCQSEFQLTGKVTCINLGHDGNALTSLYQPAAKRTEPSKGANSQHATPAAWEGSQNLVSFVGTCLLFTLITAGAVWWGQALTGWSRPLLHGLIAGGAALTIVLAWIAESISSRQQRPGRAQYWGGIIAAACLFSVGNVTTLKWGPKPLAIDPMSRVPSAPGQSQPSANLRGPTFASGEWIDVVSLIDPPADKFDIRRQTGKNDWRKENDELVVAKDEQASKLLLPLDSEWKAFECELELTRRSGLSGLNVNIPTRHGNCPVVFDAPGPGGVFLGSRDKGVLLAEGTKIETGKRATIRVEVRREQNADRVSVALNGTTVGQWSGDRNKIAKELNEGFPADRRMSLWIHPGGNEFVFHRIRLRMLDGETATTLRPVPGMIPKASATGPESSKGDSPLTITGWHGWPMDAPPPAIAPFNAGQAEEHQEAWAKHLGVPIEYTNSLGMKFRLIPPGEFTMGSSDEEMAAVIQHAGTLTKYDWFLGNLKSEAPARRVRLTQPFSIGVHEVTTAQFGQFVQQSGYRTEAETDGKGGKVGDALQNEFVFRKDLNWSNTGASDRTPEHPVTQVTWNDAQAFCRWLSEYDKRECRLCTEAEWEYCCRAGTATPFYFGDTVHLPQARTEDAEIGAVGSSQSNAFGLFDLHGNVSEFCLDRYRREAYSRLPPENPRETSEGNTVVVRGDSAGSPLMQCRSAARSALSRSDRSVTQGFRVVLTGATAPPK